jgi:hypothetical protein
MNLLYLITRNNKYVFAREDMMAKNICITIIIASLIIVAGIGCNNEKTELAWKNEAGAAINDIIWANDDERWSKPGGYEDGTKTESKEVSKLDGTVVASIFSGNGFVEGEVRIAETGSNSLSLNEGSSEVYTISDVITP